MSDDAKKPAGDSPLVPRGRDREPPMTDAAKPESDPAAKVAAALRTISTNGGKTASGQKSDARNAMLESLVYGDNDLVGLVAYAMHEVNRRDWCLAYENVNGRPPSDGEQAAYLVGEQLERRLDTYRRLAEDALAKVATGEQTMRRLAEGVPDVGRIGAILPGETRTAAPAAAAPLGATPADKAVVVPERKGQTGKLIGYLAFLLLAVVGLALVLKYGMDLTQPTR